MGSAIATALDYDDLRTSHGLQPWARGMSRPWIEPREWPHRQFPPLCQARHDRPIWNSRVLHPDKPSRHWSGDRVRSDRPIPPRAENRN